MHIDELYKFSDGTLTRLLTSLNDITNNINMEYLPKRRWSNLEKKRAHYMIKDINKLLKERRLMRSLEKFIGVTRWFTHIVLSALRRSDNENNARIHESMLSVRKIQYCSWNPVKRFFLNGNPSDQQRQSVKVKEIQERCIIKAFQDNQIKKGMNMSVQKSQDHEMAKFTRWRYEIMLG
ncbi:hypothetical protein Tco_0951562 [Tanacetum coccineum]|uniref:Translocon at the inner envelope membrane of chloroplasts 214 n=1 Tax=Tanacetum coccineum TaxID=301880 RepID=A0ABQ5DV80_9ASTR